MKRIIKTGNKTVIMAIIAAMCLTGCAGEKNRSEENAVQENIPGMVKVESSVEDSSQEETGNETQETVVKEQESGAGQLDGTESPSQYDVQQTLEDAEKEASALQRKLMEDASLNQADMNTLSGEIYQVWDGVLNELWKNVKSTLDEEKWNNLLEEQRTWIAEKEAEVKQAGEEVGGGSLAPLVANQRAAKLTRLRVYELASYLGFEGTLITFQVEGMEEVVPAMVFEGLHYTLTIPTEGWEMIASECWASEANGEVQFWVTDYAGEDVDDVLEKLLDGGYEKAEFDPYMVSREDEEGILHYVKLFSENEETIGIFYCYPAEAAEGFGSMIRTIVDTFDWDMK